MTTGMQRLSAAISGKPCDRIPVFCNLFDQGAKELGVSLEDYYSKGEYVAEAQLKMRARYGYDNVWSMFYVGREAQLLGSQGIEFAQDGPPNVSDFVIKELDDIQTLEIPADITAHPAFEEPLKCLKILKREAGGKYPICAYISSSMVLPALLMGMEKWFELLFMGPSDLRDELLRKCHQFFVREVNAYRENGADLILYSNPFGSPDTVPMKFFMQQSLPWIKKDIEAIGREGVIYYCGSSRFNRVLEPIIDQTGLSVYYLSPFDDVAEGKKIIAGRGLTCGVINDISLINWQPQTVRDEVRRIIEAGRPGGPFLFGTCLMPYAIPEENITAMLEAAYEFGARA